MNKISKITGVAIISTLSGLGVMQAQSLSGDTGMGEYFDVTDILEEFDDSIYIPKYESVTDSLFAEALAPDTLVNLKPLPRSFYIIPKVFVSYNLPGVDQKPHQMFDPDYSGNEALRWLEDDASVDRRKADIIQYMSAHTPYAINYLMANLPEPPKKYEVVVNPKDYTIEIFEQKPEAKADVLTTVEDEFKRKNWLHTYNSSLQFSQAFVSPNWYQGGNNNVNGLLNLSYNVKLNQKFHPNYLFETNIMYKLGMNSVQDDPYRKYNISEDIFQFNTTFGIKAVKKWYYTFNAQFKTQLLNSYTSGTETMRSAFLSPGELNAGIGMTYNTSNAKKTFTFDASISPVSYNMMICTNKNINAANYGIEEGHTTVSKYGSSAEVKVSWKLTSNISLASRLFGFTDYSRAYADMENTLVFEINKFLTTQLYVHLRYDTNTPKVDDAKWRKLQVKEILSLGFAYKFSTV